MITAHREDTIITGEGTLTLKNLPFSVGASVEVIVLPRFASAPNPTPYPLRGTVLHYNEPFTSAIPVEDWDANT